MSSPADQPALPAGARVRPGGGRDVLVVDTQTVRAEVSLDGGQLISWSPSGQEDLLWLSPLARSGAGEADRGGIPDRKSTRLNSSHVAISYAVFCLKKTNGRSMEEAGQYEATAIR